MRGSDVQRAAPDVGATVEAATGGDEGSPLARFSVDAAFVAGEPSRARDLFERDGLLHIRGAVPRAAAEAVAAQVAEELPRRRAEGDASWFGDVHGYGDANVGGERWDLKLALTPEVRAVLAAKLGCLQGLLERLRPSWQLAELAAMCTFPGDPGQPVHSDTSHIFDQPAVTIFVALHVIAPERGPTRFYPRTHKDNEVLMGYNDRDEGSAVLGTMECGDCCVMDSRLLHCGTANTSSSHRFLFYSTWTPPVRKSRGSTNTLLAEYEERELRLSAWRDWAATPGS